MRTEAREALDDIGVNIPRLNVPVARLSGGQRQAIAVARTVHSEADILLLDEPLAAMGAKEGALILDLIARLKQEGRVSMIMVLHNYVHVLTACDRVNLIQDGVIALDKPTSETSVEELTEIVVDEYRRARQAAQSAAQAEPWPARACVIGIDFGTLSGRAVVVRVQRRRRARLGGARVRQRRDRARRCRAAGAQLPAAVGAAGPRRLARGAAPGGAGGRGGRRHRARRRSSGSPPTSPPPLRCRCSPTARRCARCRDLAERPHA